MSNPTLTLTLQFGLLPMFGVGDLAMRNVATQRIRWFTAITLADVRLLLSDDGSDRKVWKAREERVTVVLG